MSDFRPLGPPLPQPKKTEIKPIEEVAPGIYRVDGKLETWIPKNENANRPVYSPSPWDAVLEAMKKQQDDGFPVNEFGVL